MKQRTLGVGCRPILCCRNLSFFALLLQNISVTGGGSSRTRSPNRSPACMTCHLPATCLPLACHHWILSCRVTTCHGPLAQLSSSLQRVCGIHRACGDRTRGGHLMSKYDKSISFVDPKKLILLECHDGARTARTTDQALPRRCCVTCVGGRALYLNT